MAPSSGRDPARGARDVPVLCILAAGASRRLGTCKALVQLGPTPDTTPLALLLAAGRALGGDARPLVVTGADHERIQAAVAGSPDRPELVHNPDWERGRTGGVCLAAGRRPGRALCLAPVDVPLVPASVFRALAAGWRKSAAPTRGWLAPRMPGHATAVPDARRFGHPVVLGPALLEELMELPPETPLRALRARAEPLLAVEVGAHGVLDDLDTPEDLERLRARFPRLPSPHGEISRPDPG